jgi:hypothetical protein
MSRVIARRLRPALLGAAAAGLVATTSALGGSGVGATFDLGETNTVNAQSVLTGDAGSAAELKVEQTGPGPALALAVNSSSPPFKVNSNRKVPSLNADLLDGLDTSNLWQLGGNSVASTAQLGTTTNQAVELKVNGQRILRLEPRGPGNVIGGSPLNKVTSNADEATVFGGGPIDFSSNQVTDEAGTVSGGEHNQAGDAAGTGFDQRFATVAGGSTNTASGDSSAVGGGFANKASGTYSTVPGGLGNVAGGSNSFAAGSEAHALHNGSFVWEDFTVTTSDIFASTAPNQFLIRARGGVGVGTNSPLTQLHVVKAVNATATPPNHVAVIENSSTGNSGDVLGLKIGYTAAPTSGNNFITFFKGNNSSVGSIEGNNGGGVVLAGPGSDYAEWLPKLHSGERLLPGDVVGVFAGRISKATRGAAQLMVVSSGPIVAGNDPGAAGRARYAQVAFVGQVPVRVRGPVRAGDLVVASGRGDGTALAVPEEGASSVQLGRVVGHAWASVGGSGVHSVRVAVGTGLGPTVQALSRQNRSLQARVAVLEREMGRLIAERR